MAATDRGRTGLAGAALALAPVAAASHDAAQARLDLDRQTYTGLAILVGLLIVWIALRLVRRHRSDRPPGGDGT